MSADDQFVLLDIGGTWIKGALTKRSDYLNFISQIDRKGGAGLFNQVERCRINFSSGITPSDFLFSLRNFIQSLTKANTQICGIGISTAGKVNYNGKSVDYASSHISALSNNDWRAVLEEEYCCQVVLINDAEAAAIGMAELNILSGMQNTGIVIIGTGLGFCLWRNGRRWYPSGNVPLPGSIIIPGRTYNEIVSASQLSAICDSDDLSLFFSSAQYEMDRDKYINDLVFVLISISGIYNLDEICLSGGIVEAAMKSGYDLSGRINSGIEKNTPQEFKKVKVRIVAEGNMLQLIGAAALINGETIAAKEYDLLSYRAIQSESPFDKDLHLHRMSAENIIQTLWQAEQYAGENLKGSLENIAYVVNRAAVAMKQGGRIIYVGAGTSGRIAAIDAVEIPCTYGLSKEKILTVIAGGVADAGLHIESDFEEDASSIPEMLFLNIQKEDIVIGISASAGSYFVQSALSFTKSRGAYTVLLHSQDNHNNFKCCHLSISMFSGKEVVAGSTRMKEGTATKKILNFISTSVMILLGKVHESYMINFSAVNNKLIKRASDILFKLYKLPQEEAMEVLKNNEFMLGKAISSLEDSKSKMQGGT